MSENEKLKTVGIRKDDATKLTQDIERQRPDKPVEIRILQKEKEMQKDEPAPPIKFK
jgi:hypothetical protein